MTTDIKGNISCNADIIGRVSLGEGSTVEAGAEIQGPVHIGQDTSISGEATIGPYVSIGNRCKIGKADISSTVIMDAVEADFDFTLEESVIGPRSCLSGEYRPNTRVNITIGADSSITIGD